jgi:hypothetical protein
VTKLVKTLKLAYFQADFLKFLFGEKLIMDYGLWIMDYELFPRFKCNNS